MPTILSTKKLALNQKELLLNSGMAVVEYDAINIEFLDFEVEKGIIENAIFSSKNTLRAIRTKNIEIKNCFCVGEKTSAMAKDMGLVVSGTAENSAELANIICTQYNDRTFLFYSGNKRRDEMPEILKENNINFKEITVYKTELKHKKFDSHFDGIMFFSPTGVQSFVKNNKLDSKAFCIGETTATEARKHTAEVIVANKPAIENVIAKVVSEFRIR